MPDKQNPQKQSPEKARTLEELLAASTLLAARADAAAKELNAIASEMKATRKLIEDRLKEERESIN